ncbi:putative receptor protein kinase ZmPK1 [Triticum dicoccoides]|nr:putative receptor protein kinase ZmPK1 [Triticum dicoccoides]
MRPFVLGLLITVCGLSLLLPCPPAVAAARESLTRGASIAVEDYATDFLRSPGGTFACGFYRVSPTVFTFSVWFTRAKERSVVWTADRTRPVHSKGSRLTLDKRGGALILTDYDGEPVWNSTVAGAPTASRARLRDTGNLVVVDADGRALWQSFHFPTDTLLPTQRLTATTRLVSSRDGRLLSSGYYSLGFSDYAMLSLFYDNGNFSSIYWPNPYNNYVANNRRIYNFTREAAMDALGNFLSSDNANFQAADLATAGVRRRLTLDADGNLRAYSLDAATGTWAVSWMAFRNPCTIHGVCGANAVCLYAPAPSCACAPGHERTDPGDWTRGCRPTFRQHQCGKPTRTPTKLMALPHSDFWGYDLNDGEIMPLAKCARRCRTSCACVAFQHKANMECYLKSVLFNGRTFPGLPGTVYIKVPVDFVVPEFHVHQWQTHVHGGLAILEENITGCGDRAAQEVLLNATALSRKHVLDAAGKPVWPYLYGFLSALLVVEAVVIGLGCLLFSRRGLFTRSSPVYPMDEGYRLILLTTSFQRYSYAAIKKATGNFADEIGRGGSGVVYRGVLDDGRVVAVKALTTSVSRSHGEEEFQAELSVIGRIYHMNLVRIIGCCSQGKHRILVSEFIENGSLATMLLLDEDGDGGDHEVLGWSQRFRIAVGVARGLAYLHSECLEWIIHCDMKPENILLDRDLEPKITDFGLAKLLDRRPEGSASRAGREANPSGRIRGTRGYMAPEWVSSLAISDKVDVYSFGVVLLELVKGVRVADGDQNTDVRAVAKTVAEKVHSGSMEDLVDDRLAGDFNRAQVKVVVGVALSCLEEERNRRPSMSAVVQALVSVEDA